MKLCPTSSTVSSPSALLASLSLGPEIGRHCLLPSLSMFNQKAPFVRSPLFPILHGSIHPIQDDDDDNKVASKPN